MFFFLRDPMTNIENGKTKNQTKGGKRKRRKKKEIYPDLTIK
jgi:hypothetical protein